MDDQRKLSDLTDLEIADLTQKLKANTEQALVGPLEPISALVDEYEGAPSFLAKISGLEKDGWSSLRRTRGDGDCYYRCESGWRGRRRTGADDAMGSVRVRLRGEADPCASRVSGKISGQGGEPPTPARSRWLRKGHVSWASLTLPRT